jgi:molybdate transport system ATP-binding protein
MALIARAMVKSPMILILDEPCQGLDPVNQALVLDLVNRIGTGTPTRLIYVTHHPDEIPYCTTHILRLGTAARTEDRSQIS